MNKSNEKKEYYETGEIKTHANIKDGIEHGVYFEYHRNGELSISGIKIKGKKNGLWKRYDSKGKIISAKQYYNDNVVHELELSDFIFKRIKLKNHEEIDVPKNWEMIPVNQSNQVLLSIRKNCSKYIKFCPTLNVIEEDRIASSNIDSFIDKNNELLKKALNNFRIIKERKYEYDGTMFYEEIYAGENNNLGIGGISTFVFTKKKIYIITGNALNEKGNSFLKYEGLFKEITNSFRLN
ncbi:PsbP-related protein [Tenacibaculum maritimum]|uniref:PsbP-related protein n=1 Tax=Tenacibaculum maritimum TaxID=107401 RepID=UPI00132FF02C|nr:PsbP-related protein [Tenacibaculum maritimum]